jgi:DNA-binding beta-propeller fold protein YncE
MTAYIRQLVLAEKVILLLSLPIALLIIALLVPTASAQQYPQFEVDPLYPELPFGDKWLTGGIGGMCIDSQDHVYLLNRQNVVADDLDGSKLAPPVIELDAEGRVVRGWGDPDILGGRLHDCHVESNGNIWIVAAATGYIQKWTNDGSELLMQIGESGAYDSSDGSRQGSPLNSDRAQFFLPGSIDVDPTNGDIYVADGELPGGNARVAVLNSQGEFLRQWQLNRSTSETELTPLPHCLRLSADGFIYVCDREADRIQVFDKRGNFIRNIAVSFEPLSPADNRVSGSRGTAVVLAFSPDQAQRYLYVVNQNSVMIDVLDRETGERVSSFGEGPGRYRAQFTLPHGIGVDSKGNVYIAEQEGRRLQKFNLLELN